MPVRRLGAGHDLTCVRAYSTRLLLIRLFRMQEKTEKCMQFELISNTLHKVEVRVNYREGGLYVIYSPEDAQRPRAVYHIQPNFEVIN